MSKNTVSKVPDVLDPEIFTHETVRAMTPDERRSAIERVKIRILQANI